MVRILLGSIAFVIVYNLLFFPVVFGIALPIFILALHIYLFMVRDRDSKNTRFGMVLSLLSIVISVFSAIKSNESILVFNTLSIIFLTLVSAFYYKQRTQFWGDTFHFLLSPIKALFEVVIACFTVFSNKSLSGITRKTIKSVWAIISRLVSSSSNCDRSFLLLLGGDPIFRTLVGKLSLSVSERVIISIIVFMLAFFWGLAQTREDKNPNLRKWSEEKGEKFALSSLVVSGAIAILFGVFLAIQLKYLFLAVPEAELIKLGINIATYSEYVRQGFFNLISASVIATSVIVYILRNLHLITTIQKKYLQITISLLTFEALLLMLSAGKRLLLYTQAHGLSHIRIYGALFLVWLAAILIVVVLLTFKKVRPRIEFASFFTVTMIAIVCLNIIPIDRIIAVQYPPTINGEIDMEYVAGLSFEAKDAWVPLIEMIEKDHKRLLSTKIPADDDWRIIYEADLTVSELSRHFYYLDHKYGKGEIEKYMPLNDVKVNSSWQAFNLSEFKAFQHIQKNRLRFEELKNLYDSLNKIREKWYTPVPTQTPTQDPIQAPYVQSDLNKNP